jgi:hypothetical protein
VALAAWASALEAWAPAAEVAALPALAAASVPCWTALEFWLSAWFCATALEALSNSGSSLIMLLMNC